jgi:hypothetical protein
VEVVSLVLLIGLQTYLIQTPARALQLASPVAGMTIRKRAGGNPQRLTMLKDVVQRTNQQEKNIASEGALNIAQRMTIMMRKMMEE